MWYEIIPSFAIIVGAMTVPTVAMYYVQKGISGNPYRRNLTNRWERLMYTRDMRLTGDAYKTKGLEAIPDK
ncbi:uncharacterized protein LOC126474969 [Schistocerca serialis cubense]|uniref:uncharacterized protein LOC126474969 n=1 Tax=Schistocerca serialis cubense TaxID=2023355 RepID=UPI00214F1B9F|nr:uncharacterized protein LOC126474969 [Schistocerca serialis cubense]